jgi:hypothetical protein
MFIAAVPQYIGPLRFFFHLSIPQVNRPNDEPLSGRRGGRLSEAGRRTPVHSNGRLDGTPLASSSGLLASSLQAPEWKGSCCDPDAGEAELGGVQPALVAGTMLVLSQTPDAFVPTSPVGLL